MYKYTKERLESVVKESKSMRQVLARLNLSQAGGSFSHIKKRILLSGLDISHFKGQGWKKGEIDRQRKKPNEYLVMYNGKVPPHSDHIKKKMLRDGVKKVVCEKCGRRKWLRSPIPLELHHKNRNRYDFRPENIELLCPNCHALV